MATAALFDDWDDMGMAFTEEQVQAFDPMLSAASRANRLMDLVPVVQRRSWLGELPHWWTEVARHLTERAGWDLFVVKLPKLDVAELNAVCTSASGEALKALTLAAHKLGTPDEFLAAWRLEVNTALRMHVTLGRRCKALPRMSGWSKARGSLANKVAYALLKEYQVIDLVTESLKAYIVGSSGSEGAAEIASEVAE